jgi:hypothetical protein
MVPTIADRHRYDARLSSHRHRQEQHHDLQISHRAHLLRGSSVKPRRRYLRADPLPRHPLLYVGITTPRVYVRLIHRVPGLPGAGRRRVGVVGRRIESEPNSWSMLEPLVTTEPFVVPASLVPATTPTVPRCPSRSAAESQSLESSVPERAYGSWIHLLSAASFMGFDGAPCRFMRWANWPGERLPLSRLAPAFGRHSSACDFPALDRGCCWTKPAGRSCSWTARSSIRGRVVRPEVAGRRGEPGRRRCAPHLREGWRTRNER